MCWWKKPILKNNAQCVRCTSVRCILYILCPSYQSYILLLPDSWLHLSLLHLFWVRVSLLQIETKKHETCNLGGTSKKRNGIFWEFFQNGGRGHPISQKFCTITKSFLACQNMTSPLFPKVNVRIVTKLWQTFFVKTKNDPYGLKCKINPKKFQLRRSQKGGWGRSAIWEQFPNNTVFFTELTPKIS